MYDFFSQITKTNITENQLVYAKIFENFFSIRSVIDNFTKIFDFIYIVCLSILVYRSLTVRKHDNTSKKSFNTISTWFGIIGFISIVIIFVNFYQATFNNKSELVNIKGLDGFFTQKTFVWLLVVIVGSHAIIVLTAFSCTTYYQILTSLLSYFFYAPSYVNLFFIYAFCRIDDLSWGTKGLDSQSKSKQASIRQKFTDEKIKFCLKWLSANVITSLLLIGLANNYDIQNYIIWIFSAYFAFVMVIKVCFVIIYLLQYYIVKKIKVALMASRNKQQNLKQGQRLKVMLQQFIQKMKNQEIDKHVDLINEEIIKKQIYTEAYENQRQRIIQQKQLDNQSKMSKKQSSKGQQAPNQQEFDQGYIKRISFNDLKRISNIGNAGSGPGKSRFSPSPPYQQ